jgi:hypothetical protein
VSARPTIGNVRVDFGSSLSNVVPSLGSAVRDVPDTRAGSSVRTIVPSVSVRTSDTPTSQTVVLEISANAAPSPPSPSANAACWSRSVVPATRSFALCERR